MDLQQLCKLGQQQLMRMEYLRAEFTLLMAEQLAIRQKDFDSWARLYMPLQECRRQRRQRCSEGVTRLDIIATGPEDEIDAFKIAREIPHGQVLVAGWGSVKRARDLRSIQKARDLYLDVFTAAVYPVETGRVVAIIPLAPLELPVPVLRSVEELVKVLPPHTVVLNEAELPKGSHKATVEVSAFIMSLWERLHRPFLAEADACQDLEEKIKLYRRTLYVDYACELAHQKLSATAALLARNALQSGR